MMTENGLTATGPPKEKPGIVLVDLDGTMASYAGWGDGNIGTLLPGAKETMARLKAEGHKVLVWTTRGDTPEVRVWLAANGIEYDGFFPAIKPMDLTLILDDRAFRANNKFLDPDAVLAATTPDWKHDRTARAANA